MIPDGKQIITDNGYIGEVGIVSTPIPMALSFYVSLCAVFVHTMRPSMLGSRISSVLLNVFDMVQTSAKLCLRQLVSFASTRWRMDPHFLTCNWY